MSESPFQAIFKTCESLSLLLQSHVSRFINRDTLQPHDQPRPPLLRNQSPPLFSFSSISPQLRPKRADETREGNSSHPISPSKDHATAPVSKEELGRATWTLLHTLAAQFPDHPTKQQKRDVKELMAILSRIYPCKECADHFKEVLKWDPNLSFPSGFVMCTMLSTEALGKRYSPAVEWTPGGVNWTALIVHAICKELLLLIQTSVNDSDHYLSSPEDVPSSAGDMIEHLPLPLLKGRQWIITRIIQPGLLLSFILQLLLLSFSFQIQRLQACC